MHQLTIYSLLWTGIAYIHVDYASPLLKREYKQQQQVILILKGDNPEIWNVDNLNNDFLRKKIY